jgi:hypothetical protein
MMGLDAFFMRKYDKNNYNCAHFVVEVYKHLTGRDITAEMQGFLFPIGEREASLSLRRTFKETAKPIETSIVLFQGRRVAPHVGIYLNRKVFHLTESGVYHMPVEVVKIGFKTVRFFSC